MKTNRSQLLILSSLFCISIFYQSAIHAQQSANSIITAVPFLRIVPDARTAGMGDAGIAMQANVNAVHLNSSRLGFIDQKGGFSFNYTPWLQGLALNDIYLGYASGFYKINNQHTVAAGLKYFSLGSIEFADSLGITSPANPREIEFSLSYIRKLSDHFSVGVTPKFIFSDLAGNQQVGSIEVSAARALAIDFSGTYKSSVNLGSLIGEFRLGAAISNLGTKVSYTKSINGDYLPANLGIGTALKLNINQFNTLTIVFDINKLLVPTPSAINDSGDANIPDYKEYSSLAGAIKSFGDAPGGFSEEINELIFGCGIEYFYNNLIALRAGYYTEHATKGGLQYFTTGIGIKFKMLGLNVSYLVPKPNQRNALDNTLRFSLLYNISQKAIMD